MENSNEMNDNLADAATQAAELQAWEEYDKLSYGIDAVGNTAIIASDPSVLGDIGDALGAAGEAVLNAAGEAIGNLFSGLS